MMREILNYKNILMLYYLNYKKYFQVKFVFKI